MMTAKQYFSKWKQINPDDEINIGEIMDLYADYKTNRALYNVFRDIDSVYKSHGDIMYLHMSNLFYKELEKLK
jgi:hypothetical protein